MDKEIANFIFSLAVWEGKRLASLDSWQSLETDETFLKRKLSSYDGTVESNERLTMLSCFHGYR